MNSQDIFAAARLTRVRELQTALARAAAENARLRDENDEWHAHFDLALTAAADLAALAPDGKLVLVDGWNLILGAPSLARDRDDLLAQFRAHLREHADDFVWIVLDGPRESVAHEPRLRVSYTGGRGEHRADRLILDFLRMARFRGDLGRIEVRTRDKDLLREIQRLRT